MKKITLFLYGMIIFSLLISFSINQYVHAQLGVQPTPTPPTGLTATAVSSSQINLSWTAPTDNGAFPITGYQIERSTDGGTTWSTIVQNTGTADTTYSDTGLSPSTMYTYRVSTVSVVVTSSPSNTASATTPSAASVPGAPAGLTATASSSQINLSWNGPADNGGSPITNYNIYRSTSSGTETLLGTTGNVTSYTDGTVTNGQTYYYKASAINSVGESSQSNEASAMPSGPATAPQPPTGLTATAVSSSQINLSWTAPTDNGGSAITGYKIEHSNNGGTNWSIIVKNTGSTSTTYSNTGLAASTTYTYRVSAINSVGTSSTSNTASATTQSTTSCGSSLHTICLNINSVNVGTDVRVTGSSFSPNSQITISYDGTAIGVGVQNVDSGSTTPSTITTDSNGNFVAIMEVLRSVTGTHTISAQDGSNTAKQSVTVVPNVFIYPTRGKPGSTVLVPPSQGNGFAAKSTITIKFDGTTITPSTAIVTDDTGNFGGSFMIPSGAASGAHTITMSDASGHKFSTSFTVDPNAHAFSAQSVASGMNFPAYFAFIPDNGPGVDGSGAFMVNEKNTGNVVVFTNVNGQFVRQTMPFVTVPNLQTAYETNGLLGIAFDPNWANPLNPSKYVYLYVTRSSSLSVVGELIRYHATTDTFGNIIADQAVGEQLVLGNIPAFNNGHNGGSLKFDSQGNLYISTGDGWQFAVSQDLTTLQGKMLRITPHVLPDANGNLYSIPTTNPFASSTDTSIKKEIWAYGVRNPYSFDIDSKTGKVYVSDPGYNTWERIEDLTSASSNAGWPNYESPSYGNPQNLVNYVPPLYWFPHQGREPLTGPNAGLEALSAGAFYHGTSYPNLDGAYFYGDYGIGYIEALLPSNTAPPTTDPASGYPIGQAVPILYGLTVAPIYMEEWNGKLYFLDLNGHVNVLNYN